jgi:hypothetical protein
VPLGKAVRLQLADCPLERCPREVRRDLGMKGIVVDEGRHQWSPSAAAPAQGRAEMAARRLTAG